MLNQTFGYETLSQFQQLSNEFAVETTPFELMQTYQQWLAEHFVASETQTASA